jgi:hypothetical protein
MTFATINRVRRLTYLMRERPVIIIDHQRADEAELFLQKLNYHTVFVDTVFGFRIALPIPPAPIPRSMP